MFFSLSRSFVFLQLYHSPFFGDENNKPLLLPNEVGKDFFFLILVVNLSNLFTFQLMWRDLKVVLTDSVTDGKFSIPHSWWLQHSACVFS